MKSIFFCYIFHSHFTPLLHLQCLPPVPTFNEGMPVIHFLNTFLGINLCHRWFRWCWWICSTILTIVVGARIGWCQTRLLTCSSRAIDVGLLTNTRSICIGLLTTRRMICIGLLTKGWVIGIQVGTLLRSSWAIAIKVRNTRLLRSKRRAIERSLTGATCKSWSWSGRSGESMFYYTFALREEGTWKTSSPGVEGSGRTLRHVFTIENFCGILYLWGFVNGITRRTWK